MIIINLHKGLIMKKILLAIFAISLFSCTAQAYMGAKLDKPLTDEELKTTKIFEYDNLNKEQIFNLSLQWMAETFVSSKSVIEYQDIESGKIIGNGKIHYNIQETAITLPVEIPCYFNLSISCKENRLRIQFYNYRVGTSKQSITGQYQNEVDQLNKSIKPQLEEIALSLNSFIKNGLNDEEW